MKRRVHKYYCVGWSVYTSHWYIRFGGVLNKAQAKKIRRKAARHEYISPNDFFRNEPGPG